MKRALAPIALAVGIGLFAGTGAAVAAPPTPNDRTTETLDCPGFQVDAVYTGKAKVIDQSVHDHAGQTFLKFFKNVGAAGTATLTGPAPASKVLHYSLNGTIKMGLDLNIVDFVYTGTGRNMITDPKHGDYPGGIFLTVGKVTWTLNAPDYPNGGLTGPGTITDVCQLLAP
ncbi:MAG: hypothetical protein NTU93_05630 [Arthrobacter sp.]|nr:hypothetical protein [Arthrobacter sp.]